MVGLQMEHWILEVGIVVLGLWAVWNSLPRDPNISWSEYQQDLLKALEQLSIVDPLYPKPLTLLEWSDIKVDSKEVHLVLQRRLADLIVVGRTEHVDVWKRQLELSTLSVDWSQTDSLLASLEAALTVSSQRFVFVVEEADAEVLLAFLHAHPAVRDFTGAVLFIDPIVNAEWMMEHFNNDEMDVEANISVPYFVCLGDEASSFPMPTVTDAGWKAIDVIECASDVLPWARSNDPHWVIYMGLLLSKRKESV